MRFREAVRRELLEMRRVGMTCPDEAIRMVDNLEEADETYGVRETADLLVELAGAGVVA